MVAVCNRKPERRIRRPCRVEGYGLSKQDIGSEGGPKTRSSRHFKKVLTTTEMRKRRCARHVCWPLVHSRSFRSIPSWICIIQHTTCLFFVPLPLPVQTVSGP